MRWTSALSERPGLLDAAHEAADAIDVGLNGASADLLMVFATHQHAGRLDALARLLSARYAGAVVLGCTASGVIGGGLEREEGPALSLTAANLPDVAIHPFYVGGVALPEAAEEPEPWRAFLGAEPGHDPALLLLADPFTADVEKLLSSLDIALPGAPKVGGLASGGRLPGMNRLIFGERLHAMGAVGLSLHGDLTVDPLVSQGCRPIGPVVQVDRCHRNVVFTASAQSGFSLIEQVFRSLSPYDRELFRAAPLVGIAPGDAASPEVLIRNLVGFDRGRGSFALSAPVEVGQTLQLHLRDGQSADRELRRMLQSQLRAAGGAAPAGALLFSCAGRGEGLFGVNGHDSRVFAEMTGGAPVGGFFCGGEIGPVQQRSFLHGFTSAFALFRGRGWS